MCLHEFACVHVHMHIVFMCTCYNYPLIDGNSVFNIQ